MPAATGRSEKADSRTADLHVREESDRGVVARKLSNKAGRPAAERVEGRPRTEENAAESHMCPTQSGKSVSQGCAECARERGKGSRSGSPHFSIM